MMEAKKKHSAHSRVDMTIDEISKPSTDEEETSKREKGGISICIRYAISIEMGQ